MSSQTQPTFAGGEVSPSVSGRVDLDLYQNSLAKCRNFIVLRTGGIANRPGFEFCGPVINHAIPYWLLPFSFNTEQTYILELGNFTMRVIKDGAYVLGTGGTPVVFATPWPYDVLSRLQITQSADVMWVASKGYPTQKISRTSHTDWSVTDYTFVTPPFQDVNPDKTVKAYASAATGTVTVTATAAIFKPSDVGQSFFLDIADYGDYTPWAADTVFGVGDYTYSDQKIYKATAKFTNNPDFTTFKTGATQPTHTEGSAWDGKGSYDSGSAGSSYNIGFKWQYINSGFGFGTITAVASDGLSATVQVVTEFPTLVVGSTHATYKWAIGAFGGSGGYPAAVGFYQQRLVFACTALQPQTAWMSKTNVYNDQGASRPTEDNDAISFTIGSREVNEIRHIVPLQVLLLLTSGGEFKVATGDGSGTITPSSLSIEQQGGRGSSYVSPLVIGSTALYVQAKGSVVRDLGYQYTNDSFTGDDLSVRASHLFDGFQIVQWAYVQVPYSAVFAVRNDGKLLCLTYMREQSVVGWSLLETDGYVESVAAIGEGDEDVLYLSIRREVGGDTVRYVERMHTRLFTDRTDAFFVDSGLTYDGRNTGATTVTITAADYTKGATLTATLTAELLDSSYVGRYIHVPAHDDSGVVMVLEIIEVVTAAQAHCTAQRDVPESLQALATTDWGFGVRTVTGLDHLEGKTCAILADGAVKAQQVVDDGTLTLDYPAVVIHAGLPYRALAQTLDLYSQLQGTSMRDKRRNVSNVSLLCEASAGVMVGPELDALRPIKQRDYQFYDQTAGLITGMVDCTFPGRWDRSGRVLVVQDDPLPLSVLSITPEFTVGG